jgi:hypothetical protein
MEIPSFRVHCGCVEMQHALIAHVLFLFDLFRFVLFLYLQYMAPMLAAGEILRRTMWGFFRIEYEHICTQRLAISFI